MSSMVTFPKWLVYDFVLPYNILIQRQTPTNFWRVMAPEDAHEAIDVVGWLRSSCPYSFFRSNSSSTVDCISQVFFVLAHL